MPGTSGGETEKDPSGWTTDTLRMLLEQRLSDERLRAEQRFQAQQEAIAKLEIATEKRFEGVNEFRAQLADQAHTFMNRNESIQRHDATAERIGALETRVMEALALVNSRLDLSAGRGAGLDKGWTLLVGAVGFVATISALIFAFTQ